MGGEPTTMILNYYQEFVVRTAILITALYLSVPTLVLFIRSITLTLKHPESKRLMQVDDQLIMLLPPTTFAWLAYLALLYL